MNLLNLILNSYSYLGSALNDEGKGYALLNEGNHEKETNGTILETKDIRVHPHEPHIHHNHHPPPDQDNNGDDEEIEDNLDENDNKGRTPYIHHDHHPHNDYDNFNEEEIEESFVSNHKKGELNRLKLALKNF
jgi:hypothetical protein